MLPLGSRCCFCCHNIHIVSVGVASILPYCSALFIDFENLTLLKGADLHHFASNQYATKRVWGQKGIMKDPDAKELVETVSNKERKKIVITAKLNRSHKGFSILW